MLLHNHIIHTIGEATVFGVVGLDMGASNPAFAVLAGRDDDALQVSPRLHVPTYLLFVALWR